LETCCGLQYDQVRYFIEKKSFYNSFSKLSLGFSRIVESAPDTLKKIKCSTNHQTFSPDNLISRSLRYLKAKKRLLRRKENSSQDLRRCLRVRLDVTIIDKLGGVSHVHVHDIPLPNSSRTNP
jgi:hypothetical protein